MHPIPVLTITDTLAVEPQEVVLFRGEATDWRFVLQAGVRAVPIVAMEPDGQLGRTMPGCWTGNGIGPFSESGLDEAFGLSVGFWRLGFCAYVFDPEIGASRCEDLCFVAGVVIGHDAGDGDAKALIVGEGGLEESDGAAGLLVGQDLGESAADTLAISRESKRAWRSRGTSRSILPVSVMTFLCTYPFRLLPTPPSPTR